MRCPLALTPVEGKDPSFGCGDVVLVRVIDAGRRLPAGPPLVAWRTASLVEDLDALASIASPTETNRIVRREASICA
jgi:hypothetical protein